MPKLLVLFCVSILVACSTQPSHMYGRAIPTAQNVSVQALLGGPKIYDGKEVHVVGVVEFEFGFGGMSGIYTSKDDRKHNTFSYVCIASVGKDLGKSKVKLEQLNGKYVLVEGVFHMTAKQWNTVCIGTCWPSGYLSNINRVEAWPY